MIEFLQLSINSSYIYLITIVIIIGLSFKSKSFKSLLVFAYNCFFKPFSGVSTEQQLNLELFYKNQASIYDKTRKHLLKGRQESLQLVVSHLDKHEDLVWIDIGGGTGSNIEYMSEIIPICKFKKIYLVDLSPSLCEVAKQRFAAKGWENVEVKIADAANFKIDFNKADIITYSYSLSMIPTFYNTIDHAVKLLDKSGIVASVDFGIQSNDTSIGRINTVGGLLNRNLSWWNRNFWRIWFEADKVFLDLSRRNYLEYKFGTIKSLNCFNKKLGNIPYYIWIGCNKSKNENLLHRINCLVTESPYLGPADTLEPISDTPVSKGHEAVLQNLQKNLPYPSIYYQHEIWRVYFDEINPQYNQFKNEYIYAFTWEDPREDHKLLKFSDKDTVLAITSAGDNIVHYASLPNPPKKIHAVDLNPCQNHLLELKLASLRCLSYSQIWSLFGNGKISNFNDLLIKRLSKHLCSQTLQYWMEKGESTFGLKSKGLYDTGSTRWALRLAKALFSIFGAGKYVEKLCNCESLEEQINLWNNKLKPTLLNPFVATLLIGNPIFLWSALGVPANQAKLMGNSILKYVVDTLDPVVSRSLISKDNYFYYLTLKGHYTRENCPNYLTEKGHGNITSPNASGTAPLDNIRLHTDTLNDVFYRLQDKSITIAIIMDHMDWFDPKGKEAAAEILALKNCLAPKGRVLLRSAASYPWYIKTFEHYGFRCEPAAIRESGSSIDRINMYASTWICTKSDVKRRISSLKI